MFSALRTVTNMIKDFSRTGSSNETVSDTGFHGFINRVSRLPRLFLLFGAIGLFVWPMFDPDHFKSWTSAISTIPENMWVLILMIVGSWATTKFIRDVRDRSPNRTPVIDHTPPSDFSMECDGRFANLSQTDDPILDEVTQPNATIEEWKRNAHK